MKKKINDWLLKGQDENSPQGRKAYSTFAGVVGIIVNIGLGLGKTIAGSIIGSVALVGDGLNNFSDSVTAIITLVTARLAQKPRDKEHPFGHGRLEYVGGFAIGFFILLMAWEILRSSTAQIFSPTTVLFSWLSVAVLGISILTKIGLYFFYTRLGKKLNSLPLKATGKDALSDVLASGAVLISLLLNRFFAWNIDGYIGLVVVGFIGKNGWDVCKETGDRLIGGQQNATLREEISQLLLQQPGILGIHDLHIHDYGPGRSYATVDAEVDAKDTVVNIHRQIDHAEREVEERLNIFLSIHMDPIEKGSPFIQKAKKQVTAYLAEKYPAFTLHDFQHAYMGKMVNLYFDVVIPEEYTQKTEALQGEIESYVQSISPRCRCIIDFDVSME